MWAFKARQAFREILIMAPYGRQQQMLALDEAVRAMHPEWSNEHRDAASVLMAVTLISALYDEGRLNLAPSAVRRARGLGKKAANALGPVGLDAFKRSFYRIFIGSDDAGRSTGNLDFSVSPDLIRLEAGIIPFEEYNHIDKTPVT